MEALVARILVDTLELDIEVDRHIPHQYSRDSAKKSEVVSMSAYFSF